MTAQERTKQATARYDQIIALRAQGLTMREIGERQGCSKVRISQIVARQKERALIAEYLRKYRA